MVLQDDLAREIELLKGKEYVPEAHVLFSLDLCRRQLEAKERLRQEKAVESSSPLRKKPEREEQVPVIDINTFTYEGHALEVLWADLCDTLVKHERWESGQAEHLKGELGKGRVDLSLFIRKAALGEETYFESFSRTMLIADDGLLFLGFQVGKPLFEMLSAEIRRIRNEVVWGKAICPVCGHEPDMAKFDREIGKRILHCPLCDSEWAFRRLQCPFCLNDSQDLLRFFFIDEKSPYRVDVCDECRRYIKTVDERKVEEDRTVRFALEDIATFYLDVAAWKEGFKKPNPHIPEFRHATVP